MAKLSTAERAALPKSDFAVPSKAPGSGSYPIPDAKHAGLAKGMSKKFGSASVQAAVMSKAKAKGFGGKPGAPKPPTGLHGKIVNKMSPEQP